MHAATSFVLHTIRKNGARLGSVFLCAFPYAWRVNNRQTKRVVRQPEKAHYAADGHQIAVLHCAHPRGVSTTWRAAALHGQFRIALVFSAPQRISSRL
jgi:hypothetical protein